MMNLKEIVHYEYSIDDMKEVKDAMGELLDNFKNK